MCMPELNAGPVPNENDFFRWLLREAVRANPMYVISAALVAYAIEQLMTDLDPQIGKLAGIVTVLGLLHLYEIAALVVATIVLKRRTRGGLDMHGLLIVAALYLGATFIALDELIAIRPTLGLILVPLSLLAAAFKLYWYSRLPGVFFPARFRNVMLVLLGAHSLSPLVNSGALLRGVDPVVSQGYAWLVGWCAFLWVLHLICTETGVRTASPSSLRSDDALPPDPLATRNCGIFAVTIASATSLTHLLVSDWIFDRTYDFARLYPLLIIAAASFVLIRWRNHRAFGFFESALALAPCCFVQYLWREFVVSGQSFNLVTALSPAGQVWAAAIAFYIVLAQGTGNRAFYAGITSSAIVPIWVPLWKQRSGIPYFRALLTAGLGFVSLALGLIVSLYREAWLKKLKS